MPNLPRPTVLAGGAALLSACFLMVRFTGHSTAVLRSLIYSLAKSKSIRNILLSSLVLTGLARAALPDRLSRSPARTVGGFATLLWALYYKFRVDEYPVVRFRRTLFNVAVVERAGLAKTRFHPTFWAWNRHAQTGIMFVLSHLEWLWHSLVWRREAIPAGDGNELHLDWACWDDRDENFSPDQGPASAPAYAQFTEDRASTGQAGPDDDGTPIIVLVHGLGDSTETPYVRRAARAFHRAGWRCVVFSYWRCDFYQWEDLSTVVKHVAAQHPSSPLVACAWSAGGHLLLRYLQHVGKDTPLVAAVSLSGCMDMKEAIRNVIESENATYRMFLNQQLRVCVRRHMKQDVNSAFPEAVRRFVLASFGNPAAEYDRFIYAYKYLNRLRAQTGATGVANVTGVSGKGRTMVGAAGAAEAAGAARAARAVGTVGTVGKAGKAGKAAAAGAAGAAAGDQAKALAEWRQEDQTKDHYYNVGKNMDRVELTTLVLHADDDPVCHGRHVDWDTMQKNKHIIACHTRRGGHVAWFDQVFPFGDTWR